MRTRAISVGLAAALCGQMLPAQTDSFAFMPPGGREILARLVAPGDAAALVEVAGRQASAEDWAAWAATQAPDLGEQAIATFAGYAALNLPASDPAQAKLLETGDLAALPPDGKDLAIAHCQYCHSFFTGYLMQDRDEVSWLGTFKSPFHAEIPMSDVERATFASYSALNMPLKYEDVPPELRY